MKPCRPLLAAALALLVAALAGCASSTGKPRSGPAGPGTRTSASTASASSSPTPSTARHRLQPAAGVPVTERGNCWTSSITVANPHAYRCFSGDQILDPCFSSTGDPRAVVCYADPWSTPVAMRLTAELPVTGPPLGGNRPWAIELDGGVRCVASPGVVPVVGKIALSYACRNGGAAGLVTASASAPMQSAMYRPAAHAPLRRIDVTDAWTA